MAYLHCHNCGWSQDDFWNWTIKWSKLLKWDYRPFGYNPLSLILEDLAIWGKPRMVGFDKYAAIDYGFKLNGKNQVHSWVILRHDIKCHFGKLFNQQWWSDKSFKRDYNLGIAQCPKCKSKDDFDID